MLTRGILSFTLVFSFLSVAATAQQADIRPAQKSTSAYTPQLSPHLSQPDDFWLPRKTESKPNAVTPPRIIYSVDPGFPADAPKGRFFGITKVTMVVDKNGEPQQVHVEKSLGPDFDKVAIAAAR